MSIAEEKEKTIYEKQGDYLFAFFFAALFSLILNALLLLSMDRKQSQRK